MCLITEQQESFISEEDIIVYKILTDDLRPFYCLNHGNTTKYILGKLNEVSLEETDDLTVSSCHEDFYFTEKYGIDWRRRVRTEELKLKSIGRGFHAYLTQKSLRKVHDSDELVVECIIPKGSKYYKNEVDLIVSNKIIINKIIKL